MMGAYVAGLSSDGEEEQVSLLMTLGEHALHPVDALAQFAGHVGLGLLQPNKDVRYL